LPLSGATVALIRVASSNFFGDFSLTTGPSGIFSLTGLHPGEWLIYAQAPGRLNAWYSGDANNPATAFANALPIEITGTNTVNNADIHLAVGGGQIRGRVTRHDNGQPVQGSPVTLRGWPLASTVLN